MDDMTPHRTAIQTDGHVAVDEPGEPAAPPERRADRGRSARSSTSSTSEVFADLGDRDARYIRSMIALQRRLALLGRVVLLGSR